MTNVIGEWTFRTDQGAWYNVTFYADGQGYVLGERTGVLYRSTDHRLELTGKRRQHSWFGPGCRAILHIDTGEGIVPVRGVVR